MKNRHRLLGRAWWRGLVIAGLASAGLIGCGSLDEHQRRWIFQPSKNTWGGAVALSSQMQDIWIDFAPAGTDPPARLHALWHPQARADAPHVLYLHGARWDVASSARRIQRLHDLGFSVLAIDYRGFGRSSDALPSEDSAAEDARAAWSWLEARAPKAQRYVYGHSLGGAIAVRLASEVDDEAGLVVEASFTSIPDVFSTMRFGWLPITPLITQRFNAAERIALVKSPVIVVHGSDDSYIPPDLGRALYERAASPKRLVLVEGGTHHNAAMLGQAAIRDALREVFGLAI
jgi:uncharacterized protein